MNELDSLSCLFTKSNIPWCTTGEPNRIRVYRTVTCSLDFSSDRGNHKHSKYPAIRRCETMYSLWNIYCHTPCIINCCWSYYG